MDRLSTTKKSILFPSFISIRFIRKYMEKVFGFNLQISSPEDTILAKLQWAKLSHGSEKQITDALRVYEVQYKCLDIGYMNKWSQLLGLESLFQELKDRADTSI